MKNGMGADEKEPLRYRLVDSIGPFFVIVFWIAVAVFVVYGIFFYEASAPADDRSPASSPGIASYNACDGADCDGNGIPDHLEDDVQRAQQDQLAEDYCDQIGSGDLDSCREQVESGNVSSDDVYGPPEPPADYGSPEPPTDYGGGYP